MKVENDDWANLQISTKGQPVENPVKELHEAHSYAETENNLIFVREYELSFNCPYDLKSYPFDSQSCPLDKEASWYSDSLPPSQFRQLATRECRKCGGHSINAIHCHRHGHQLLWQWQPYPSKGSLETDAILPPVNDILTNPLYSAYGSKVGVLRDSHNLTLTFIFEWNLAPASDVTGELTLPF
jgi:hypothetical protein